MQPPPNSCTSTNGSAGTAVTPSSLPPAEEAAGGGSVGPCPGATSPGATGACATAGAVLVALAVSLGTQRV